MSFDFSDAPPANGSVVDYVTPGTYLLTLKELDNKPSSTGKPMVTASFVISQGRMSGKRLVDRFTFPINANDSVFPKRRFHAMLAAIAGREMPQGKTDIDLDKLLGKQMWGEVVDDRQEARTANNGTTYPARTVSQVAAYHHVGSEEKKMAAGATEQSPIATAPVPAPIQSATVVQAQQAVDMPDDNDLFGAPAADAPVAAVAVADPPAPAPEPAVTVAPPGQAGTEEDDDLFA